MIFATLCNIFCTFSAQMLAFMQIYLYLCTAKTFTPQTLKPSNPQTLKPSNSQHSQTLNTQHNMKLTLLVVGKTVGTELPKMIDTYVQRLMHYIPFEIQVIPDLKNTKSLSESQQKQLEGEAILRAVDGSYVVLLDEHGKEYRSVTFASQLQSWLNTSTRGLTFVIGGPYGFSEAVYQRADAKISLSQMTFSHQMIRLLFVEQLYRAMTILRGEPYHHE